MLSLCLEDQRYLKVRGPKGGVQLRESRDVGFHGNAVNRAGKMHSTDEAIFVWSGNCLRRLGQLDGEELRGVKELFDAEYREALAMTDVEGEQGSGMGRIASE